VNGVHIIAIVSAAVTLTVIFELARRSQLGTKYMVVWLGAAVVITVFAIAPGLFNWIAHGVGVKSPPNLLLVLAALFLLMVCVYLSWEAGRLEDKTRVLAEEVALLRNELEEHTERRSFATPGAGPATTGSGRGSEPSTPGAERDPRRAGGDPEATGV
jgi:hypothetical protein